ncbi:MAG: cell division protein FtsW [Candidatus Brennerbacteria bacterium RIFOXYC1_FULL_41_11]|uniref:Probable peptidoglycan glycosyltransferase FtsW n=1 Tax=Candidatus Brennerbacteria bacterium RIFOXYD1_FULL_41_16 TaxID=1797529 RepID=A0A1G1XL32_9BACT|nr:MAG: Stage V sporulation protein E [Parcubacteria group bacterium GW2011_GWB1_41_4]OGY39293.1 MAG: cell division protein FtsW [Candidatus Brennerbacteria bacterium RIFOXYB1_FULL_41_13]OGY39696.1 MAG: cell division protein FtsW [Candidatus Brennerbacteria bacterium RIFOXYC1_FULL_41_11]OGY40320.1 MAG: cell division protein FtsW [Candidatus Brennerbacteria bacterium RIFOXYD1_FULL_41_16]
MRGHEPDKIIFAILGIFIFLGLFLVFDASSIRALQITNDALFYFKKQLLFLAIGLAAFFLTYKIDFNLWKKLSFVILILGFMLLLSVFIPGLGAEQKGATRWIYLGPISIQPAEFFKITFIIYLASFFSKKQNSLNNFLETIFPFLVIIGSTTAILLAQHSFGMLVIILIIAFAMFFVAGAPVKKIVPIAIIASIILGIFLWTEPYRRDRLMTFFKPEQNLLSKSYQINQALISIGSGGMTGVGLGHSRQKFEFLPETMGDSVFAIFAEETGFVGVTIVLIMISVFAWQGFNISRRSRDNFPRFLSFGITFAIVFQFLFNISAISGLIPLSGIPLPFLSYGGSSLITTLIMSGLLLNISKHTVQK